MKVFGWTEDYCRKGITGARGWVWYNWALENEATLFGRLVERTSKGYIGQESDRIFNEAKKDRK
jgi:hypothetical protein